MQESMVKFVLVLLALLSLVLGGLLLLVPGGFVSFSQAEAANLAWLRSLGASLVSVQGFGLALIAFRRRDTNPLLGIIALATTVQTGVLWYSLVTGEFTAQMLWIVIVPGIIATTAVVLLWAVWISRRRSVKTLGGGPQQIAQGYQAEASQQSAAHAEQPTGTPEQQGS
ncbi:MAG: hypothetical protein ACLFUA_00870 [Spirochaetales bacterium]